MTEMENLYIVGQGIDIGEVKGRITGMSLYDNCIEVDSSTQIKVDEINGRLKADEYDIHLSIQRGDNND